MSRTPVREALRRLEVEQLIENVPRRGLIMPEVTLEDLTELFSIREYLEGLSARQASRQMSEPELMMLEHTVEQTEQAMKSGNTAELAAASTAFHQRIRLGARNTRLPKLPSFLYDAHRSTGLHELDPIRQKQAVEEHRAIFEAIQVGDEDLCRAADAQAHSSGTSKSSKSAFRLTSDLVFVNGRIFLLVTARRTLC